MKDERYFVAVMILFLWGMSLPLALDTRMFPWIVAGYVLYALAGAVAIVSGRL